MYKRLIRRWMLLLLVILLATGSLSACAEAVVDTAVSSEDAAAISESTPAPEPSLTPSKTPEVIAPSVTPTSKPSATPTETPSWVGPENFPEGVDPLTGLLVADPELLERRPLAIKVSNFPAAGRPHSGLSFADLVWEYFIGSGMTRFLALFYGQDASKAGPIRSGRPIDGQLVRLYGGVLGMKGADKSVMADLYRKLPNRVFNAKPASCPALCPYTTSHTYGTFSDTDAFSDYATEQGVDNSRPNLEGMRFDSVVPEDGKEGERLWIYYSFNNQVGWNYDQETGLYLRSQDKADGTGILYPMTDQITGQQLSFSNVVMMFAWHEYISPTLINIEMWHANDRRALVFRDGKVFECRFSMIDPDKPLSFKTADGDPFPFKPGNTWFEIVGLGSTLEELEEGYWKTRFYP